MAGTQIRQDRQIVAVAGVNKYEILVTCTLAGTLPDTGIFLLQLTQSDDPKDDTLVRVCDVTDFDTYLSDRNTARTNDATYWRSAELRLQYDDADTANAAYKEIISRINALVSNQDVHIEEFETPAEGEYTNFPVADPSDSAALVAVYEDAKTARETAEVARDAKQVECANEYQKDLEVTQERHLEAQTDLESVLEFEGQFSGLQNAYISIVANIQNYVSSIRVIVQGSSATATEKQRVENDLIAVEAILTQMTAHNTTYAQALTLVSTFRGTLQARVSTLATQINTLTVQLNQCNVALAQLQSAVDAARAVENEALTNVVAICPDFTP